MKMDETRGESAADAARDLRRRAEEEFAKSGPADEGLAAMLPAEAVRLLHELRVHQIELEMQNEELRRAQAALDSARERYFELYEMAPVGYVTLNVKTVVLEANLRAAVLLGRVRGELARQPFTRFIDLEDQDVFYLLRKRLFETGEAQTCELRMTRPDGERFWARLDATATRNDSSGAPFYRVTISDISERKRAKEALVQSEKRAAQAEKLAAIAKFGGGVAHEMNNILCGISLATQCGIQDLDDNAVGDDPLAYLREILETISASANRGARIVSDIKLLATPATKRSPKPFLVQTICDRLLNSREPEFLARKIRVERIYEPDVTAMGDPDEIEQVILNLILNAEHAMIPKRGGVLRASIGHSDGKVEIRVQDTGIGMTDEVLKQAFLPFYSTKGAFAKDDYEIPGTGLGLAICARIIEDHGGSISARSLPGEGSVFSVYPPIATARP